VHGVRADVLRRAGRYDEALTALDAALTSEDDDEPGQAATVLAYIRGLAEAGDDGGALRRRSVRSED
jgi:predicted RNA polymerase sigma factor